MPERRQREGRGKGRVTEIIFPLECIRTSCAAQCKLPPKTEIPTRPRPGDTQKPVPAVFRHQGRGLECPVPTQLRTL